MSYLSFQITHAQENQSKCIIESDDFEKPAKLPNWAKWSTIPKGLTNEIPSQLQTRCQRELITLQVKNKLFSDSRVP